MNTLKYKDIEKKEYEIEIITPMFLGGANPKEVELRTPPFKGMLRFWWRALHPNLVQGNNFKNLYIEESKIFGDLGNFGKSKVSISIDKRNININEFNPLPHRNKKFGLKGFIPSSKFTLTLNATTKIHKLFEFASIVGGVGKRARRGFGSFIIKNNEIKTIDLNYLSETIKSINSELNISLNGYLEITNNFEARYPFIQKIYIGKDSEDYNILLKNIGESSHKNNSDFTGYATKDGRLASPVYVSITKDEKYKTIITVLRLAVNKRLQHNKQQNFINYLL